MKYLLLDTSANGKPVNYQASPRDTDNWPRLVHLAWMVIDEAGKVHEERSDFIKPQGFNPNAKVLTQAHIEATDLEGGVLLKDALEHFMKAVGESDYIFAHNLALHQGILTAESDRLKVADRLSSAEAYCLMQETTYYCAIPGRGGRYKWPSLVELHKRIFKKSYQHAGHAEADVKAISRCFIVLYKLGVLEDLFE